MGNWVSAILLASVGGTAAALFVMLAFRAVTGTAAGDGDPGIMMLMGYVVWAAVALAISAWWLRRSWLNR